MIDRAKKLNANAKYKMVNDLSPKKTTLVLVIVIACFAVLWPKVFYPMLVGSANNRIKPSQIDRTQGCCDVISEKDVTTIKVMFEICNTIIQKDEENSITNKELISKCQNLILETCGIDISAVLQKQVKLGHTTKQILEEIRSLNGSLCLKYNFGVAPWKLGVPHRVTIKMPTAYNIRQERPLHLRSEMVHPAFRERGRAIPQAESFSPTKPSPPSRLIPKVFDGRPGPLPGMRPTLGGAGHVVPPPKHGGNSMGLIMPIYTIGIVVFFTYTVMKIVFKKQPEVLYPPVNPDPHFRREVFEVDRGHSGSRVSKEGSSGKLGEMDQLRLRLRETEMAMERIVEQMAKVPLKFQDVMANGNVVNQDDQGSVQVLGMETTASCEGGQKWTRPSTPVVPVPQTSLPPEPVSPPQEIYLEGSLPPQSHLLVTDSATETQKIDYEEDPAVVLAGKMTLSVISLDSTENGTDESSSSSKKHEERSSSNVSEEFEKIDVALLEAQINEALEAQSSIPSRQENVEEFKEDLISKTTEEDKSILQHLEKNFSCLENSNIITEVKKDESILQELEKNAISSESKEMTSSDEEEKSLLYKLEENVGTSKSPINPSLSPEFTGDKKDESVLKPMEEDVPYEIAEINEDDDESTLQHLEENTSSLVKGPEFSGDKKDEDIPYKIAEVQEKEESILQQLEENASSLRKSPTFSENKKKEESILQPREEDVPYEIAEVKEQEEESILQQLEENVSLLKKSTETVGAKEEHVPSLEKSVDIEEMKAKQVQSTLQVKENVVSFEKSAEIEGTKKKEELHQLEENVLALEGLSNEDILTGSSKKNEKDKNVEEIIETVNDDDEEEDDEEIEEVEEEEEEEEEIEEEEESESEEEDDEDEVEYEEKLEQV